jgi:nitrogen regulatory protein PII
MTVLVAVYPNLTSPAGSIRVEIWYAAMDMMKTLRCILGPEYLPAFVEHMAKMVPGMTVAEARHHDPSSTHQVSYRGVKYEVGSLGVVVDVVIDEGWVDDLIRQISDARREDRFSVEHVSVIPVEASYHIRNGFMDV